eukprot:CAMPEP_0170466590 /NCGR_PEP_ID=MMETSP0123-20130129/10493_1 /TAXON_ID=182087 /ORGANISM="Favella ehrenbergii, Strain Fehren 1" /LENGTH=129 /DNA_ID=CAMNT_0010732757 /DNA_START=60 /DNA_END=449 /DNA_ORIENTATION=-
MTSTIEQYIGISAQDFKQLGSTCQAAFSDVREKYLANTHPKLRLLDNLIAFSIATFFLQVVYGVLVSRDPFYSFIAGVFCSLGVFAMSASLRVQLTDPESFSQYASKRLIFEYIIGTLLVFFASLLLMG